MKRRSVELLDRIGTPARRQRMAPRPPNGHDLGTNIAKLLRNGLRLFGECHQNEVEVRRGAAHQVVDAHRGSV